MQTKSKKMTRGGVFWVMFSGVALYLLWYYPPANFLTKRAVPSGTTFELSENALIVYRLRIYSTSPFDSLEFLEKIILQSEDVKVNLSELVPGLVAKEFVSFSMDSRLLKKVDLNPEEFTITYSGENVKAYVYRYSPAAPTKALFWMFTNRDSIEHGGRRIF